VKSRSAEALRLAGDNTRFTKKAAPCGPTGKTGKGKEKSF
jgi:hypothetical protein